MRSGSASIIATFAGSCVNNSGAIPAESLYVGQTFVIFLPTYTFHAGGRSAKPQNGDCKPKPLKATGRSRAATVVISAPKLWPKAMVEPGENPGCAST